MQPVSWGEYWDKLPATIAAGAPPNIAFFHNSRTSQLVSGLEPFPEDLFPLQKMRAEYFAFDQAFLLKQGDRQFYFLPAGVMSSVIFYNRDLWDAVGLAAVPTTWDELRLAGKKLARRGGDDQLQVAGFSMRSDVWTVLVDTIYQQGGWLFSEDGNRAYIDTPEARRSIDLIEQMLFGDRMADLPNESGFEMAADNTGMQYKWTWYRVNLDRLTSLRYGVFRLPTFTGSMYPPVGRNNYESAFAVPRGQDKAHRDAAFRFLKWLYDQDSYLIALNVEGGRVPPKMRLWRNEQVRSDELTSVLAQAAPYTVFPGELPAYQWESPLGDLADGLLTRSNAPGVLLQEAERVANARLAHEMIQLPCSCTISGWVPANMLVMILSWPRLWIMATFVSD